MGARSSEAIRTAWRHRLAPLGLAAALVLAACTGGSGDAGTGPAVSDGSGSDGSGDIDAQVANGVAAFDFASARDEAFLLGVVQEQRQAAFAACVVRLGGVSTYVPRPPDRADTADRERLGDFPRLERIAEVGFVVEAPITVSAGIDREDYATEAEYADALFEASPDVQVTSDDERALADDCEDGPELAAVAESQGLHQDLWGAWMGVLREIDSKPEVHELRLGFVDCVVAAGMAADPKLHEYSFGGQAEGEVLDASHEAKAAHMRERGQLFAQCAGDLYELKERLRREAHDRFVEEHEADIARLSSLLYGDGLLDPEG